MMAVVMNMHIPSKPSIKIHTYVAFAAGFSVVGYINGIENPSNILSELVSPS